MTRKMITTAAVQISETVLNCEVEYYYTPGISESFTSPEEPFEIELLDISYRGDSLLHPIKLVSDEEIERVMTDIYEGVEYD